MVIKVNPERMDLVETRVIDGRACLVIPVDDYLEVNGMPVWKVPPPRKRQPHSATDRIITVRPAVPVKSPFQPAVRRLFQIDL